MTDNNKDQTSDAFKSDFSDALNALSTSNELNSGFGTGSSFGNSGFGTGSSFGNSGFGSDSAFGSSGFGSDSAFGSASLGAGSVPGSASLGAGSVPGSTGLDTGSVPGSAALDAGSVPGSAGLRSDLQVDIPKTPVPEMPDVSAFSVENIRRDQPIQPTPVSPDGADFSNPQDASNRFNEINHNALYGDSAPKDERPGADLPEDTISIPHSTATPADMSSQWKNNSRVNQFLDAIKTQNVVDLNNSQLSILENVLRNTVSNSSSGSSPLRSDSQPAKPSKGCAILFGLMFGAPIILGILMSIISFVVSVYDHNDAPQTHQSPNSSPSFTFSTETDDDPEPQPTHIIKPQSPDGNMPHPVFDFLYNADTEMIYTCLNNKPQHRGRKIRAAIDIEFYISKHGRAKDITAMTDDFTLPTDDIEACAEEFFSKLPDFPESSNRYLKYKWKLELYMN